MNRRTRSLRLTALAAGGAGGKQASAEGTAILLDGKETGHHSPLAGSGRNGDSPAWEGPHRVTPGAGSADELPGFEPVLAAGRR